ncbi:hypothetical protein M409DRAFT_20628 [Zasmidium cellare ATCC 36951]|uniref:DUF7730 domain-containing protein n=1 Tax=Zasmidium cellare ATCC 36951 TaxID=1080233 RepID=A0A6A6CUD9_ZASCE|nr:uncharacterized protein M409DRAFT_20628 [Zasmidium cellare ATCC 36951]KAF2169409.1 hypothetical protein M409DRAFT_20628 [Zasmidium cellare ATCC 36951]
MNYDGNIARGIGYQRQAKWTVATQSKSKLLTLPGEVRTRIYEHVLIVPPNEQGNVVFGCHFDRQWPKPATRPATTNSTPTTRPKCSVLALIQTCRLVYREAAGIFYHRNKLELCDSTLFYYFVNSTSWPRLQGLQTMTFVVFKMMEARDLMATLIGSRQDHWLSKVAIKQDGSKLKSWEALRDFDGEVGSLMREAEEMFCVKTLVFEFDCGFDQVQKQKAALRVQRILSEMPSKEARVKWRKAMVWHHAKQKAIVLKKLGALSI